MFINSLAVATTLVTVFGSVDASKVAKKAPATGRSIDEVAIDEGLIYSSEFQGAIDPRFAPLK